MISLTNLVKVSNQAHILYFFESEDYYIENLIAYIKSGIKRGDHILIVETPSVFEKVSKKIKTLFSTEQQMRIHYLDNHSFYRYHEDFCVDKIVEYFGEILEPYINESLIIRTWAHVIWREQDNIQRKIDRFERQADVSVQEMKLMSVCAYSNTEVSASLQNKMMESHEYLMTDKEFVRSPFYRGN